MSKIKKLLFIISACITGLLCGLDEAAAYGADGARVSTDEAFHGQTEYVGEGFSSSLPLVILEVPDSEILPGAEEKTAAMMKAVESAGGNRPGGEPRYSAEAYISAIRYENDEPRPKKDYFISVTGAGGGGQAPLSGLDPGSRWFLLGGAYDKSLIRNYLGYKLAGRVLDDAPDVRLCELLLKNSVGYEYRGVYLLVEGFGAEGVVTARRTEHYWEGFNQTVVYAGGSGVFVLQDNWGTGADTAAMAAAIGAVGDMFDSQDTNKYLRYGEILDLKSFYAYFLVNELMASYEDMNESVYSYDPGTKTLSIGPVWNFERALDNQRDVAVDLRRLQYQMAPFYRKMIIDSEFINGLINASKERAAAISGAEMSRLVDLAAAELGEAQERDWSRWRHFYLSGENSLGAYAPDEAGVRIGPNGLGYDESGALMVETADYYSPPADAPERIRQFGNYSQELIKLKFYASERPAIVRRAILLFRNQDELLTRGNAYGQNSIGVIIFLAAFFLSIIIARRAAEK